MALNPNPESIYKIDQLLEELESTDREQLPEKLPGFLNSVCKAVNLPQNAPFDSSNAPQQKKFIAVCLLRLLCRNADAIWDNTELRLKTFKLFDDEFGQIYPLFKVKETDQNHEKQNKLRVIERKVFRVFEQTTDSIVNLDAVQKVRQNYMNKLNSDANKLFLEQFVTQRFLNTNRINQIFAEAQAYNESSIADRFTSYQAVETVFDPFLREAKEHPSIFTERCIIAPVNKIYNYIREDFENENNDAIKPTTVSISPLDRKYPFHVAGIVELKFRVENQGPGLAFDVQVHLVVDEGLRLNSPTVNLGTLEPHQSSDIVFETAVEGRTRGKNPSVMGAISWQNFDKERKSDDPVFDLPSQRTDLNWNDLETKEPYSLDEVKRSKDLVGRATLIKELRRSLSAENIASSIIRGQKRVGKTSIAKVVQAEFKGKKNYTVVFISIGSLDKTTSEKFVASLGSQIVRNISRATKSFAGIAKPSFEGALSPLVEYFEDAMDISPDHRFIIILDEFDEIPLDMVRHSSGGDTFFHNIRAISSSGYIGFVLVGGENMRLLQESTDRLNRMGVSLVDYFDKGKYWNDFQELVRRPVKETIEFNDEAINTLYEMTEGNPFYTKLICRKLYTQACDDRNSYISENNVEQAIRAAVDESDLNHFNHFWKDGILVDDPARKDQIETQRRKFLIAFAQIRRKKTSVNIKDLRDSEILNDGAVDQIIESYTTRGVLIEEAAGHYRWKPKFFERWLIERGYSRMTSTFLDEDAITALEKKEQDAYVQAGEIVELSEKWGSYRNSEITPTHVRAWLDQFEDNIQKRLMFSLLKRIYFYDESRVREKMAIIHEQIQSKLAQMGVTRPADRRERRQDILLSSFGKPAQSGPSYARMYAATNSITVHNVASFDGIPEALGKNDQIRAIVFVDDIIASGGSAVESLRKLNEICGVLLKEKEAMVFISSICSLQRGREKLENAINEVPFEAEVIVSDPLTEADQCFSEKSEVFNSPEDRNKAKQIARDYGKKLQKPQPLGYKNGQLLVVFHDNCPNNTLPILWRESTGQVKWTPLFKRN